MEVHFTHLFPKLFISAGKLFYAELEELELENFNVQSDVKFYANDDFFFYRGHGATSPWHHVRKASR